MKKISDDSAHKVQRGLNALAKTSEFTRILQEELAVRHLVVEDVTPCIKNIHYDASRCISAHDNDDDEITVYSKDYTIAECAILVTFLRIQGRWPYGLEWWESKMGRR